MIDTKPWYQSRTIWAALISVAASFGAFAGIDTDAEMRAGLTDAVLQPVAALAAITAIYGRITARSVIDR